MLMCTMQTKDLFVIGQGPVLNLELEIRAIRNFGGHLFLHNVIYYSTEVLMFKEMEKMRQSNKICVR